MSVMASHITSLTIVYSTVYWSTDQRKHQSSMSLDFVRGIHRWPHKGPVTWKMFPFDDIIMFFDVFMMLAWTNCWTNSQLVMTLMWHPCIIEIDPMPWLWKQDTVWCHYNAVSFLLNPRNSSEGEIGGVCCDSNIHLLSATVIAVSWLCFAFTVLACKM